MILVDTSPILAALNRRDPEHTRCPKLLDEHARELSVTPYVVTEVRRLVGSRMGALAEADVIEAVTAGDLRQVDLLSEDSRRHRFPDRGAPARPILRAAALSGAHKIRPFGRTRAVERRPETA